MRALRFAAKSGWRGEILSDVTKKAAVYTPRRKWCFLLENISNISWVHCLIQTESGKGNTDTRHLGWQTSCSEQAGSWCSAERTGEEPNLHEDCPESRWWVSTDEGWSVQNKGHPSAGSVLLLMAEARGMVRPRLANRDTEPIKVCHQFPSRVIDCHMGPLKGGILSVHSAKSQKPYLLLSSNGKVKTLPGMLFRDIWTIRVNSISGSDWF